MSRLQKKCFIGATSLHALLLLALVVGPGFFTKDQAPSTPMIEIITDKATDAINPNPGTPGTSQPAPPAAKPPEAVKPPAPAEPVEPPTPTPRFVQREEEPQVKEPLKEKEPKRNTEPKEIVPDKPKKAIKISNTTVKLTPQRVQANSKTASTAEADAKADAKAAAQRAKLFTEAGRRIGSGISSSTDVKLDGPVGNGGAGLANYGQIVRKRYTDAWIMPTDLTDDEATVRVSVTIARDGKVISARIIDSSGSSLAANSIQKTLDRVTHIGVPFPDGATESQRTFTMTFNMKAKKSLG